ncbi:MAG: single-stranded DNA-binding protein, partial [Clostridiales bacterium]|nr:single-stranded DNA-binding protein [Clostridiales bacterium]
MENGKAADNNIVNLSGTISEECVFSHEVYGEGFYIFQLDVRRLSENADTLPVTISDRLIDINSLKKGVFVSIKGQLRSYNHYSTNKNKLILTTFAREIELGGEQPDNPNEIFL